MAPPYTSHARGETSPSLMQKTPSSIKRRCIEVIDKKTFALLALSFFASPEVCSNQWLLQALLKGDGCIALSIFENHLNLSQMLAKPFRTPHQDECCIGHMVLPDHRTGTTGKWNAESLNLLQPHPLPPPGRVE